MLQRMLISIGLAGMLLAGPACRTVSREPENRLAEDCRTLLQLQERAWNRGDIEGFLLGYLQTENLRFVGSRLYRGIDELRERYRTGYPDRAAMGRLEFRDLEVDVLSADTALVTGSYHLTRDAPSEGRFTLVMRRGEEGLVIVYDHTSEAGE